MVEPAEDERMKRLEERLAAARKAEKPKPRPRIERQFSEASVAWRMVTELVAGLAIGFGIGYTLDGWTGHPPLFMVLFTVLGFVAGVRVMLRTAKELNRELEAEDKTAAGAEGPADREGK